MQQSTLHDDKKLFEAIAEGNEAAFEILFHRYVPKVEPVIRKIVQSDAVAKDLVQDIFLILWLGRTKLAEVESPSHWIFRIVYNRAYSWLEQQTVQNKIHSQISINQQQYSLQTEENVLFGETSRLVREAIHLLPPQTQKIYRMSREEGLKNADIAESLQISVNTVKNTLVNAGKSVREHLEKNGIVVPLILLTFYIG